MAEQIDDDRLPSSLLIAYSQEYVSLLSARLTGEDESSSENGDNSPLIKLVPTFLADQEELSTQTEELTRQTGEFHMLFSLALAWLVLWACMRILPQGPIQNRFSSPRKAIENSDGGSTELLHLCGYGDDYKQVSKLRIDRWRLN